MCLISYESSPCYVGHVAEIITLKLSECWKGMDQSWREKGALPYMNVVGNFHPIEPIFSTFWSCWATLSSLLTSHWSPFSAGEIGLSLSCLVPEILWAKVGKNVQPPPPPQGISKGTDHYICDCSLSCIEVRCQSPCHIMWHYLGDTYPGCKPLIIDWALEYIYMILY